jgi:hypothetical protein
LLLRALGPFVVVSTLVVFASGIVLLELGPADRGLWVGVHKASFILWLGFMGLHVLGHLWELPGSLAGMSGQSPGLAGRWIAIGGALVAGLVIAIALIPQFASWTAHLPHHQH